MCASPTRSRRKNPGAELEDYKQLTQLLPSGFGDDMLRFAGIGEIVTWAAWTDGDPTDEAMTKLEEIIRWAASKRMGFQIHWNPERSVDKLLTILRARQCRDAHCRLALVDRPSL